MLRPYIILSFSLLLAAVGPSRSAGQEKLSAEFEGLVEVSEVLLDVIALDNKGNVVRGLGRDDFVVVENGREVELTGVSFYTTRYDEPVGVQPVDEVRPVPAGPVVTEVPSSRFFVLFFHEQRFGNTLHGHRRHQDREAGRHAHDWIRDALAPSDWVAVVSHDARLHVHQDFTQDRASLLAAVVDASRGIQGKEPKPAEWNRAAAASPFALRRGLPALPDLRRKTRVIYDAIRHVAEATRPIVGRKNLLLFTHGFGDFDEVTFDSRPDHRFYPAMKQALNDNNVALYPVDTTHPEVSSSERRFMIRLALDTGGLYVPNHVNFKSRFERITRENTGYYLLSFRAEHPAGESGYRNVWVKSKDRRIQLRARRGYRYGV